MGEGHRRGQPRVDVNLKVRISTIDSETDPGTGKRYFRTSQETCANVSSGGAFVLTSDPVAPGRRVLVEMEIPDGPRVQAVGRVAWSKIAMGPSGTLAESGIGVEFVESETEHRQILEDYIMRSERRLRDAAAVEAGSLDSPDRNA